MKFLFFRRQTQQTPPGGPQAANKEGPLPKELPKNEPPFSEPKNQPTGTASSMQAANKAETCQTDAPPEIARIKKLMEECLAAMDRTVEAYARLPDLFAEVAAIQDCIIKLLTLVNAVEDTLKTLILDIDKIKGGQLDPNVFLEELESFIFLRRKVDELKAEMGADELAPKRELMLRCSEYLLKVIIPQLQANLQSGIDWIDVLNPEGTPRRALPPSAIDMVDFSNQDNELSRLAGYETYIKFEKFEALYKELKETAAIIKNRACIDRNGKLEINPKMTEETIIQVALSSIVFLSKSDLFEKLLHSLLSELKTVSEPSNSKISIAEDIEMVRFIYDSLPEILAKKIHSSH